MLHHPPTPQESRQPPPTAPPGAIPTPTRAAPPPRTRTRKQRDQGTPEPMLPTQETVLGCGSFVRGRKRKKGDLIPFILSRRDYISRLHDECPYWASTHQINYPVSQSYIYQTPLVHDSPATRTQSSIEDLVPQTAPLLGTRCYLRKSSWIAR